MKKLNFKLVAIALMLALVPLLSISTAQAVPGEANPPGLSGLVGSAGSFTYSNTCGVSGTDPCKIGTVGPKGGWIFFVDYNDQYPGFTYLEAAPTDASARIEWCNPTNTLIGLSGWDANAVGRGRANTDVMLNPANCTGGAAYAADSYSTGSTVAGDWFLPSEGELMLMYTNLRQAGVGGFAVAIYWSSTEDDSDSAWNQSFTNGGQSGYFKNYPFRVRAVRAF